MNRSQALELLHEYTHTESLRKHAYAVEKAMRAYAKKYNEDETYGVALVLFMILIMKNILTSIR